MIRGSGSDVEADWYPVSIFEKFQLGRISKTTVGSPHSGPRTKLSCLGHYPCAGQDRQLTGHDFANGPHSKLEFDLLVSVVWYIHILQSNGPWQVDV